MLEIILYAAVFTAGGVTALLYLWILHLSVKRIIKNSSPSILAFLGFFFRLVICLVCFFLASWGGRFDRLAVCVIGFTLVRIAAVNIIKSFPITPDSKKGENDDNKS
jgi:hypothetical protein